MPATTFDEILAAIKPPFSRHKECIDRREERFWDKGFCFPMVLEKEFIGDGGMEGKRWDSGKEGISDRERDGHGGYQSSEPSFEGFVSNLQSLKGGGLNLKMVGERMSTRRLPYKLVPTFEKMALADGNWAEEGGVGCENRFPRITGCTGEGFSSRSLYGMDCGEEGTKRPDTMVDKSNSWNEDADPVENYNGSLKASVPFPDFDPGFAGDSEGADGLFWASSQERGNSHLGGMRNLPTDEAIPKDTSIQPEMRSASQGEFLFNEISQKYSQLPISRGIVEMDTSPNNPATAQLQNHSRLVDNTTSNDLLTLPSFRQSLMKNWLGINSYKPILRGRSKNEKFITSSQFLVEVRKARSTPLVIGRGSKSDFDAPRRSRIETLRRRKSSILSGDSGVSTAVSLLGSEGAKKRFQTREDLNGSPSFRTSVRESEGNPQNTTTSQQDPLTNNEQQNLSTNPSSNQHDTPTSPPPYSPPDPQASPYGNFPPPPQYSNTFGRNLILAILFIILFILIAVLIWVHTDNMEGRVSDELLIGIWGGFSVVVLLVVSVVGYLVLDYLGSEEGRVVGEGGDASTTFDHWVEFRNQGIEFSQRQTGNTTSNDDERVSITSSITAIAPTSRQPSPSRSLSSLASSPEASREGTTPRLPEIERSSVFHLFHEMLGSSTDLTGNVSHPGQTANPPSRDGEIHFAEAGAESAIPTAESIPIPLTKAKTML